MRFGVPYVKYRMSIVLCGFVWVCLKILRSPVQFSGSDVSEWSRSRGSQHNY